MKKNLKMFILLFTCILSLVLIMCACTPSAYELYKESYVSENGTEDGILSEEDWLLSLKVTITKVDIICGDMIIYYSDNTSEIVKNVFENSGHNWDNGVVTIDPTCITFGLMTFKCKDCDFEKKELLDPIGEDGHIWSDYSYDDDGHIRTCRICSYVEEGAHSFGDLASENDDADCVLTCKCGLNKTVGEYYSYKVTFNCGAGASVLIYNTQDYSINGIESSIAYARDGQTGLLLNNGNGQVNFEVVLNIGYKFKGITVTPKDNFNQLKDPDNIGRDNTYRITKVSGELEINIETEIELTDMPVMVINTSNNAPILDKENYVKCNVSVLNTDDEYCFDEIGAGIRGRGNTTWTMPKKPYKMKFDNAIDLFGNGSAKKWTLIANYADKSMIRNYLAYTLGLNFTATSDITTSVQFVELYLNGSYEGVYLLCEQVETGTNRVEVEDDINKYSPEDIGYLLELDARAVYEGKEDRDYFVIQGYNYAIKSPDYEDISDNKIEFSEYVSYIKEYLKNTVEALDSGDYSQVVNYVDVDSFAETYIIHELFNMVDVGYASFNIYKKNNGLLYSGPLWDFDLSSGNCNYNDACNDVSHLWAKEANPWYNKLLSYDEFQEIVSEKLLNYSDAIKEMLDNAINEVYDLSLAFERNFERWDILGQYVWPNPDELVVIDSWTGQVEYLRNWLLASLDNLLSIYGNTEVKDTGLNSII